MIDFTPGLLEEIKKLSPKARKSTLRALGDQEFKRCADDPVYWLDRNAHAIPYVYTLDPHELYACTLCGNEDNWTFTKYNLDFHLEHKHGLKPESDEEIEKYFWELPHIRAFTLKSYMVPIIRSWHKSQMFAMEKSRDMMATHMMSALIAWDVGFHEGKKWVIQSKSQKETLEIVEDRIKFILDHQPRWLGKDRHSIRFSQGGNKTGVIKIPSLNSAVVGLPRGAAQIRFEHPTGVFVDEAAFHEDAAECFSAIKPAIQQGGKYCAVSSAYPSFFQLLVEDRTE